jgi:hypothetical protein
VVLTLESEKFFVVSAKTSEIKLNALEGSGAVEAIEEMFDKVVLGGRTKPVQTMKMPQVVSRR